MATIPELTANVQIRGRWAIRLAVIPLLLATWLLRHAGAAVELRSGRYVVSREFLRPSLVVKVK